MAEPKLTKQELASIKPDRQGFELGGGFEQGFQIHSDIKNGFTIDSNNKTTLGIQGNVKAGLNIGYAEKSGLSIGYSEKSGMTIGYSEKALFNIGGGKQIVYSDAKKLAGWNAMPFGNGIKSLSNTNMTNGFTADGKHTADAAIPFVKTAIALQNHQISSDPGLHRYYTADLTLTSTNNADSLATLDYTNNLAIPIPSIGDGENEARGFVGPYELTIPVLIKSKSSSIQLQIPQLPFFAAIAQAPSGGGITSTTAMKSTIRCSSIPLFSSDSSMLITDTIMTVTASPTIESGSDRTRVDDLEYRDDSLDYDKFVEMVYVDNVKELGYNVSHVKSITTPSFTHFSPETDDDGYYYYWIILDVDCKYLYSSSASDTCNINIKAPYQRGYGIFTVRAVSVYECIKDSGVYEAASLRVSTTASTITDGYILEANPLSDSTKYIDYGYRYAFSLDDDYELFFIQTESTDTISFDKIDYICLSEKTPSVKLIGFAYIGGCSDYAGFKISKLTSTTTSKNIMVEIEISNGSKTIPLFLHACKASELDTGYYLTKTKDIWYLSNNFSKDIDEYWGINQRIQSGSDFTLELKGDSVMNLDINAFSHNNKYIGVSKLVDSYASIGGAFPCAMHSLQVHKNIIIHSKREDNSYVNGLSFPAINQGFPNFTKMVQWTVGGDLVLTNPGGSVDFKLANVVLYSFPPVKDGLFTSVVGHLDNYVDTLENSEKTVIFNSRAFCLYNKGLYLGSSILPGVPYEKIFDCLYFQMVGNLIAIITNEGASVYQITENFTFRIMSNYPSFLDFNMVYAMPFLVLPDGLVSVTSESSQYALKTRFTATGGKLFQTQTGFIAGFWNSTESAFYKIGFDYSISKVDVYNGSSLFNGSISSIFEIVRSGNRTILLETESSLNELKKTSTQYSEYSMTLRNSGLFSTKTEEMVLDSIVVEIDKTSNTTDSLTIEALSNGINIFDEQVEFESSKVGVFTYIAKTSISDFSADITITCTKGLTILNVYKIVGGI